MTEVRFELDPDGAHVWWYHSCSFTGLEPDGKVAGRISVSTDTEATMLPNGPWRVVSREPLTLQPSILCKECGCHGFITSGRWVPA